MIEGIEGVFQRINRINERIAEINRIGGFSPVRSVDRVVEGKENNTSTNTVGGKKFSEILKEVLQENGTLPGLSNESSERLNILIDKTPDEQENLKSVNLSSYSDNDDSKFIDDIIQEAGKTFGVDPVLIKAIIHQESGFNRFAVSKRGALGLMQLMPSTIEFLGVKNPFNVRENIFGGARYIKMLLEKYNGDLGLALSAYNAGPKAVDKYNGIPEYDETKNFVESVIKLYNIYKNFR